MVGKMNINSFGTIIFGNRLMTNKSELSGIVRGSGQGSWELKKGIDKCQGIRIHANI